MTSYIQDMQAFQESKDSKVSCILEVFPSIVFTYYIVYYGTISQLYICCGHFKMPRRAKRIKTSSFPSTSASPSSSTKPGDTEVKDRSQSPSAAAEEKDSEYPTAAMDDDDEGEEEDEGGEEEGKTKKRYTGGYNSLKTFQGQTYSGMAIGGSHTWNYDSGVWKETKQEPDLWRIDYRTDKRRARKAPKGSGAPVGTEYHWLIVGHQVT